MGAKLNNFHSSFVISFIMSVRVCESAFINNRARSREKEYSGLNILNLKIRFSFGMSYIRENKFLYYCRSQNGRNWARKRISVAILPALVVMINGTPERHDFFQYNPILMAPL